MSEIIQGLIEKIEALSSLEESLIPETTNLSVTNFGTFDPEPREHVERINELSASIGAALNNPANASQVAEGGIDIVSTGITSNAVKIGEFIYTLIPAKKLDNDLMDSQRDTVRLSIKFYSKFGSEKVATGKTGIVRAGSEASRFYAKETKVISVSISEIDTDSIDLWECAVDIREGIKNLILYTTYTDLGDTNEAKAAAKTNYLNNIQYFEAKAVLYNDAAVQDDKGRAQQALTQHITFQTIGNDSIDISIYGALNVSTAQNIEGHFANPMLSGSDGKRYRIHTVSDTEGIMVKRYSEYTHACSAPIFTSRKKLYKNLLNAIRTIDVNVANTLAISEMHYSVDENDDPCYVVDIVDTNGSTVRTPISSNAYLLYEELDGLRTEMEEMTGTSESDLLEYLNITELELLQAATLGRDKGRLALNTFATLNETEMVRAHINMNTFYTGLNSTTSS
jgi:hypothetical protein